MLQQSTYIQIDLGVGEAASLVRARHCRLHCLSGMLWLTEENGGGDVVLKAGESLPLTRRGLTVIQAVGAQQGARCRLELARPARPAWRHDLPLSPLRARVRQLCAAWRVRMPAVEVDRSVRPARRL